MIGDWMASQYDIAGRRYDYQLFLDHDGRYERIMRHDPDIEWRDIGRWEFDETNQVIEFTSDVAGSGNEMDKAYSVLSVTTCETSNVLLVLRALVLASRNLPLLFYRVHCNDRGYGTEWQKRLEER